VAQAEAKLMAALALLHEDAAFARTLRPAPGSAVPEPVLDRLRSEAPNIAGRLDRIALARHGLPPASALPQPLREVLRLPAALIDRACLVLGLAAAIRRLGPVFLSGELDGLAPQAGEPATTLAMQVSRLLPIPGPSRDELSGESDLVASGRSLLSAWALARFGIAGKWLALRWEVEPAGIGVRSLDEAVETILAGVQGMDGVAAP
jgi:hypothetical protein